MARGSALSRAIRFFEEGDIREVEVAFQIVKGVVEGRLAERQKAGPAVVRKRRRAQAPDVEKAVQGAHVEAAKA
jgi:hypothetical protein